ncbi:MAG: fumarylacetoacetate hydrolase family protein [bacterium]
MRLATYRNLAPGATGDRLGVLLSDGRMADLRLCYAARLAAKEGEGRPYAMANARIPRGMREFLRGGPPALAAARAALDFAEEALRAGAEPAGPDGELAALKEKHTRLRPPVVLPGKFLHTGLNFHSHLEETGNKTPENVPGAPRFSSTLIAHGEPIVHPRQTETLDYEIEVGIVIGTQCKDVRPEDAFDVIAGYTIYNDVTAREVQGSAALGGGFLGKNFDTTNPLGPHLVTADEVPNPESLKIQLRVNGETRQDSDLTDMVFGIRELVAFFSQMTLEPGDIISSGTCSGVASRMKPEPKYLKPGDVVECEVERLGVLRNPVVAPE